MPGSCGNGNTDFGSAVQFENAGALVKRGASGHYVVDQEHVFPTHVVSAFESATHIFLAFLQRETGLWQCRPDSLQAGRLGSRDKANPERYRRRTEGNCRAGIWRAPCRQVAARTVGQAEVK